MENMSRFFNFILSLQWFAQLLVNSTREKTYGVSGWDTGLVDFWVLNFFNSMCIFVTSSGITPQT